MKQSDENKGSFRLSEEDYIRFKSIAAPIAHDPRVMRMQEYIQHGQVTTYDHCINVARTAFWLNCHFHLGADEHKLVRAALLHDYFLYDWHDKGDHLHGYHHPAIASSNAREDFELTYAEQKMIESHMWPLTLFHIPTSRGGWILMLVDKLCSSGEIINDRYSKISRLF